jgi:serine/threonine protein kinase
MSTFIIKDYVVSRKRIGKGSFSTIYKAFNTNDNKEYAIKEVIIDKKSIKSNVKREFLVLKKLNHPNIVKLYDLIIDTNYNNIYFVFDYFKVGDLAKFLDNKPLKEKFCKKYSKQLADGLKYLLDNNILHRDLKPQNILLTDDYNIKIADFGFARKVDKNMLLNTLCGSPMYMAPEIINKQDYSIKSDLWSVGVIIYQMIYGRVPFEVNNFVQLIKKINNEKISYKDDKIKISPLCLDLIKNLLQVDVDNRISWDQFFFHPWFTRDDLLLEENNLLDFSISNNLSLPKLNKFQHHIGETQFASFIHKSIKLKESKDLKIDSNSESDILSKTAITDTKSNGLHMNIQSNNVNNETNNFYENDIEINFLDSLSESCDYQSCNNSGGENLSDVESVEESEYDEDDNILDNTEVLNENGTTFIHNYNTRYRKRMCGKDNEETNNQHQLPPSLKTFMRHNESQPINIPTESDYNYKLRKKRYVSIDNEYEFIDKNNYNKIPNSVPLKQKTLTESFKEYLFSSLKQSYKYITNNKSI